jgi:hypothetical protein
MAREKQGFAVHGRRVAGAVGRSTETGEPGDGPPANTGHRPGAETCTARAPIFEEVCMRRRLVFRAAAIVAALLLPARAPAHNERLDPSPARPGPVPSVTRTNPRALVVCKASSKPTRAEHRDIHQRLRTASGDALAQAEREDAAWHRNTRLFKKCRYEHIQEAVNAAGDDTDVLVMPGVYREEPSRRLPSTTCGDLEGCAYSYAYHQAHPHDANLIAILGKRNLTLEGTGTRPEEVVIDAGFAKDVAVRCDQCTGFIARNFWVRDANEHGLYVLYSDGFVFDRARGSYSKEYELFSYASDNGLYTDCEAEGGGDSGLYTGAHPDTSGLGRFSTEIRRCKVHRNALGLSGTQGNSIWLHDNDFYDNAIGISFNTQNDHQNPPQRQSLIENNLLHDNNFDIYAPTSDVPVKGPGYGFFRYPVGTALWIVGGQDNVVRNNFIYGNRRFGVIIARNPLEVPVPADVHRNQLPGNVVGTDPLGNAAPNHTEPTFQPGTSGYQPGGSDFFWDETGTNNCWGAHDPRSGAVKTDPPNTTNPLPIPGPCPATSVGAGSVPKLELLANCMMDTNFDPPRTSDLTYPCPWGQENFATYKNRDELECGNGLLDLGEDCDPGDGSYNVGTIVPTETCASLGHGPGTLGCTPLCMWDTSGCAAIECAEYGATKLRARNVALPGGDDDLDVRAADLDGAGRSFDPRTEEVSFVVRDDGGLVHAAVIPAGAPEWTTSGGTFVYTDAAGSHDRLTRIELAGSVGGRFKARVQLAAANLSDAANARTATAALRIGDDCWADTLPCTPRGQVLGCSTRGEP